MSEEETKTVEDEFIEETGETETKVEAKAETEEKVEEKPHYSENANKAINKKHFAMMEAQRKFNTEHEKAEALQKELDEFKQSQVPNAIPPMPDQFDDEFEQKVAERDNIIKQIAANEAYQSNIQAQQVQQQQQAQMQEQESLQKKAASYTENAIKQGITAEELQTAGQTVARYGIDDNLTMSILGDPDGALITKHLASNLSDLDTLSTLDPYTAAQYIERNIRPKLAELKPKSSNTPPPPTDVEGQGVDLEAGKYPLSEGATFE